MIKIVTPVSEDDDAYSVDYGRLIGIGATAKKLFGEGCTVVYVAARRVEKMHDLELMCATAMEMDIIKDEDIKAVIERISVEQGGIDVLINNAGFGMYGAMEDIDLDDARYQFEVNLVGLARLTQLALPCMRKARSGKIVNISSMGGKVYTLLGSWYHATNHALEGWSDCLRIEFAPFDIDVIVIEPGVIETGFSAVVVGPVMERSGEGPYSALAQKMKEFFRERYKEGSGSSPSCIKLSANRRN